MTPEAQAMIEKAARAMYAADPIAEDFFKTHPDLDRISHWVALSGVFRERARIALTAVIPGILKGTHAELPIAPKIQLTPAGHER